MQVYVFLNLQSVDDEFEVVSKMSNLQFCVLKTVSCSQ